MPEIPDLTVYLDFLQSHIVGETLEHVRLASPFVLRTADPPLKAVEGKRSTPEELSKRSSVDELHRNVEPAGRVADVVNQIGRAHV